MKKILFPCLFFLCLSVTKAQSDLYKNIRTLIEISHPEISTESKLIALNVWSVEDAESREANKSFEKAHLVYESAYLKGGAKGFISVSINKDDLSEVALSCYEKDGIKKTLLFKLQDFPAAAGINSNIVFDSSGNQVYKDLPAQNIFNSIQHLITR